MAARLAEERTAALPWQQDGPGGLDEKGEDEELLLMAEPKKKKRDMAKWAKENLAAAPGEVRVSESGGVFPDCGRSKKIRGKTKAQMNREKDERYLASLAGVDDIRRAIAMDCTEPWCPDGDAALAIRKRMDEDEKFKEFVYKLYVTAQVGRMPQAMDPDEKELRKLEIKAQVEALKADQGVGNQMLVINQQPDGVLFPGDIKKIETVEPSDGAIMKRKERDEDWADSLEDDDEEEDK